ncbi:hypothetical protein NPIL_455681 [Nephila pilipes]|uniref:Uncharacterized protein n=1 Tax=Nephila pilipes TaxID=299642 RepID=A0A8X6QJH7_NEPPI|nr:hypothetical protein NPIL_455681 [Nephila pilipes]
MNILSEEIFQAYPEQFGPTKQMDILGRKARMYDIFESAQAFFSLPSFFIISKNILLCGSALMTVTDINREALFCYVIIETVLRNIIDISCIFNMLWMTGELSVQIKKLKELEIAEIISKRNLLWIIITHL